ncbi:polyprenyl synthetase family protein [Streptomyces sp. NPDC087917]|uniref:polyprenyl synthetase family protein n=1 Tax=Streptomyces sp. NPDC087917 TaxID=3155060 RepID=UPI00343E45F6
MRLAQGQALDLAFEGRRSVSVEECRRMMGGKTASWMACACRLGALYGGADAELVDGFTTFGKDLGMAFQLVDDVLGIWGDPSVTGKPAGSDLVARKKSFPVAVALSAGGPLAARPAEGVRPDRRAGEAGPGGDRTPDRVARWAGADRRRSGGPHGPRPGLPGPVEPIGGRAGTGRRGRSQGVDHVSGRPDPVKGRP